MNIKFYLKINIFIFLFFVSCKTTDTEQISKDPLNAILNTSMYASNVYIGISPKMTTYEKGIDSAKSHIAHQIAFRDNCIVDVGSIYISDGRHIFYISDYGFDYNDVYIDELIKHIKVIKIYKFQELVIVVGEDGRKASLKNIKFRRSAKKLPKWVNSPRWARERLGSEYFVGVGMAERYSQIYKGIYAADIAAAQSIALGKDTFINVNTSSTENNRIAKHETDIRSLTEKAQLKGFYILDRWVEPDGSKYYSLGIALKQK